MSFDMEQDRVDRKSFMGKQQFFQIVCLFTVFAHHVFGSHGYARVLCVPARSVKREKSRYSRLEGRKAEQKTRSSL